MDDIVKLILRAVSQTWPKSKPQIITQFFEADTKFPEKFVATLTEPELHKVSLVGDGATMELAMQALQKNLAAWLRDLHTKAVEQRSKDQFMVDAYHGRLRQAWENLTPPKE